MVRLRARGFGPQNVSFCVLGGPLRSPGDVLEEDKGRASTKILPLEQLVCTKSAQELLHAILFVPAYNRCIPTQL